MSARRLRRKVTSARDDYWFSRYLEPAGILVSIGLGVAGFVLSAFGTKWSVGVVSLATSAVLSVVLSVRVAETVNTDRIESAVNNRIDRLESQILPQVRSIDRVPALGRPMTSIAESIARTSQTHPHFILDRIMTRVVTVDREVQRIAAGEFTCQNRDEQEELIKAALETARGSVKAVAALGAAEWLNRDSDWRGYFSLFTGHASRHLPGNEGRNPPVRHERFFLLTPGDLHNRDVLAMLERHRAAGVSTYALDRDRISQDLVQARVLFDDKFVLLHVQRREGEPIEVKFSFGEEDIEGAQHAIRRLEEIVAGDDAERVLWPAEAVPSPPAGG